ncbi:ACP S-malonyltransferase [Paenibacillus sp. UNC499MF]|uniref:ACP S-malonyltransferase n=1 Tax=Paenibacillus sp. UNC499MF TaxID=1502751 RepID=UPI00089FD3BE|nr:ACP S-malonyltransferase [Paenibacillus sp. UNC499MF]SEG44504.1 [acyl-carrier-protein] S-malonyltransferase [Paenibacillus sp. UNC499MF]
MVNTAWLFPGQGSQYVGMGSAWYARFDGAKALFEEASDVAGYDMKALCFEGSAARLSRTSFTQPALLTASVLASRVYLYEIGLEPRYSAGHSLGEYSALVSSGVLSFAEALGLVIQRGKFMEEAAEAGIGSMIAVRTNDQLMLEELCRRYSAAGQPAAIAGYNSGSQLVVSGHRNAVASAAEELERLGVEVTRLAVSGPFHSVLMQPAAESLEEALNNVTFRDGRWPVISNTTGLPYPDAQAIRRGLVDQMTTPVKWLQTVQFLAEEGIELAVELGPRTVLKNLTRDSSEQIRPYAYEREADAEQLAELYPVRLFIEEGYSAAVSAPNANWNEEEYAQGVLEPVRRVREMLNAYTESGGSVRDAYGLRQDVLECVHRVLRTKKVSDKEQNETIRRLLTSSFTKKLVTQG